MYAVIYMCHALQTSFTYVFDQYVTLTAQAKFVQIANTLSTFNPVGKIVLKTLEAYDKYPWNLWNRLVSDLIIQIIQHWCIVHKRYHAGLFASVTPRQILPASRVARDQTLLWRHLNRHLDLSNLAQSTEIVWKQNLWNPSSSGTPVNNAQKGVQNLQGTVTPTHRKHGCVWAPVRFGVESASKQCCSACIRKLQTDKNEISLQAVSVTKKQLRCHGSS